MGSLPPGFVLVETIRYPNGGTSFFYVRDNVADKTALIVDDGICDRREEERIFDYSLFQWPCLVYTNGRVRDTVNLFTTFTNALNNLRFKFGILWIHRTVFASMDSGQTPI